MDKKQLSTLLSHTIGNKVWKFSVGGGAGSIITFEWGREIILTKENNKITPQKEGHGSFMIYCSWRVIKNSQIIISWKEDISPNGLVVIGMSLLENQLVKSILLTDDLDLFISFDSGLQLQVFCDEGINSEFDCNWFFRIENTYYSVNNYGNIDKEIC